MRYRDPHERFWEKVNKDGPISSHRPDLGQCWIWTAAANRSNGGRYGWFRLPRQRAGIKAHRWAWEEVNGPLSDRLQLDHLCRNTLCVNPAHLEPVTIRENVLRGTNTPAQHARKTHCIHGHPLSGENTYTAASGQRMCRTCRRQWERERKARKKAAR